MRGMRRGCTDNGCVFCDICKELIDYSQCCWCISVFLSLN